MRTAFSPTFTARATPSSRLAQFVLNPQAAGSGPLIRVKGYFYVERRGVSLTEGGAEVACGTYQGICLVSGVESALVI